MYVCVCNYSSQPTEPICIKIIPANIASYADCYRLLRFEIFTPTIFKTPKTQKGREWAFSSQTSKILKLTYLGRGSNDFNEIWHGDAIQHSWHGRSLKIQNFENPRWRRRHLEKSKNTISRPWFERFRWNLTHWCSSTFLTVLTVKNLKFLKSKMAAAAILKNWKWRYLGREWCSLVDVSALLLCWFAMICMWISGVCLENKVS